MKRKSTWSCISAFFCALSVSAASAQEILPFPPTPSGSIAGLTMQDSTYGSAWSRAASRKARRTS